MAKTRSKQRPAVNPALRLSALRPRLDKLLRGEAASTANPFQEALDAAVADLAPEKFLPPMLAATVNQPEGIEELVGEWLAERGYAATLVPLLERGELDADQQELARAWLTAARIEVAQPSYDPAESFYAAYYAGNTSQGTLMFFWYDSARRNRGSGIGLLLDHEPPWDGAVKDAISYPRRDPKALVERFVGMWAERGLVPEHLSAAEAKQLAIVALQRNRQQQISLHRDLVAARAQFVQHVLTLPDEEDTPAFSAEDFDYLAANGRAPESIQREEQMFGYQTRMDDGRVMRIMRPPEFEDFG